MPPTNSEYRIFPVNLMVTSRELSSAAISNGILYTLLEMPDSISK
jgi:hypothetical protein